MKIKHLLLAFGLALFSLAGFAQTSKDIRLRLSHDKTNVRYIALFSGNIAFNVNAKGAVRLSTLRPAPRRYEDDFNNSGRLTSLDNLPIDYYDSFDSYTAGKIKSVGFISLNYIDQFDGFDNRGKVKAIGKMAFTYYDRFDGFDNGGKLKSVGGIGITYYDRFDGELNGKLKSIGNTVITYYDRFDGQLNGRIKSITGETPNVSIDNLVDDDDYNF